MRKIFLSPLITAGVFSFFVFIITISQANAVNSSGYNSAISGIPDSLMKVFKRACMDCHSADGNFFAKSKVNFSKWDKYNAKKQYRKANKICNVLTENAMPPNGWKKQNEKLIPDKNEVNAICKWTATLNTTK